MIQNLKMKKYLSFINKSPSFIEREVTLLAT